MIAEILKTLGCLGIGVLAVATFLFMVGIANGSYYND